MIYCMGIYAITIGESIKKDEINLVVSIIFIIFVVEKETNKV